MRKNRKIYPPNHWLLLLSAGLFVIAAILAFGVVTAWSVLFFFSAFISTVPWFGQVSNWMFRGFTNTEKAAFIITTPIWVINQNRKRD